jgi:hypothetical protein
MCSGPSDYRDCQQLQSETLTALYHGSDILPDWSGGLLEVLLGKGAGMRARFLSDPLRKAFAKYAGVGIIILCGKPYNT